MFFKLYQQALLSFRTVFKNLLFYKYIYIFFYYYSLPKIMVAHTIVLILSQT